MSLHSNIAFRYLQCILDLTRTIGTDPKQFRRIQNKDKASVYSTKITVASRSINHIIPVYIALVFPTKLKKVFHQCMIGTDYSMTQLLSHTIAHFTGPSIML